MNIWAVDQRWLFCWTFSVRPKGRGSWFCFVYRYHTSITIGAFFSDFGHHATFKAVTHWSSNWTKTNMSAMGCNCNRAVFGYIRYLDSCDISDNSDNSDSSDSRQEQTCLHDFARVGISKRKYLGFGGPWVCAVLALVFFFLQKY